jgi:guanine deaminase
MKVPHIEFMREAIRLSVENQEKGGGPFGAVVVKDGQVISASANSVTIDNDPTAHAEVNAIRMASKVLNTFDLSGCVIYTSCEPCPMCLGAIYWARIDTIYYGNTRADASEIGFDDEFIYTELVLPLAKRKIKCIPFLREEAIISFEMWQNNEDKTRY